MEISFSFSADKLFSNFKKILTDINNNLSVLFISNNHYKTNSAGSIIIMKLSTYK